MPATTRDFLIPVLNNVPMSITRVPGIPGGLLVALIAAVNPMSWFTKPYIGLVSWMIMCWWFYNINPLHIVKPKDPKRWNPMWWQILKCGFWGLLFNFIPMFFIYATIIFIARFDAKLTSA
jgi:hypothetical protein